MDLRALACCDTVVLGGNTAAMVCSLQAAAQGRQVLLIAPGTYLYDELFSAGDLRPLPAEITDWRTLLFPEEVMDKTNGMLHPDRLKRHGEALLQRHGIRLLYACHVLGWKDGRTVIAAKSGLYTISYIQLYDCRKLPLGPPDCFLLHTMEGNFHHLCAVPTEHPGGTARERYLRYALALNHIPAGHTLARSGTEPAFLNGINMDAMIRFGLARKPSAASFTPWGAVGLSAEELPLPAEDECDVLVVGGGTAGASAALFCARQGLKTILIEMNGQLGGTATVGGVSCYWFGLREGATHIIDEAVAACQKRYHQPAKGGIWCEQDAFAPDLKAHALLGLCLDTGVDVRFGCVACNVLCRDQKLIGVYYSWNHQFCLTRAAMTIDCTGDGDLAVLAGADYTYGSDKDGMTYWASLAHYPQPDRYRNNFSNMVRVDDPWDYTRFIVMGRSLGKDLYDHGSYVAVRESRHIRGLETVTLEMLLLMQPVRDPLYTCYSNYDPKGRLTAELCYFGLLPPNQIFTIPRGAVIPVDAQRRVIQGLLIGGKAISCTHDAFPGIRMQADLQRQGLALAALAGCAVAQGVDAAHAAHVVERIRSLGGDADYATAAPLASLESVIDGLTGQEPWEWLDAPVTACETAVAPVIRLLLADRETVVPLLRARYEHTVAFPLRLLLARILLWHHDDSGANDVITAVRHILDASPHALPRRIGSINYGQMLPDHGLMPEPVYLIHALAYAPNTKINDLMADVLDRLTKAERDWYDLRTGIYCWCECFGWVAQRRNDQSLVPMIRRILSFPEFKQEPDDPLLSERICMLSLELYSALKKLGCDDGKAGLRRFVHDRRASIRRAAEMMLM